MWLCVVQFSNSQRNPRAANRSRSFHSDLPRSGAGARSAANPHAACDAAGTGNGITATPTRARRGKPWIRPRSRLRVTAPVPDPTTGIASGLLLKAIQNWYRGRFIRAQDLFDEMYASLADRSTRHLLNTLIRIDCLLVDELGYLNLKPEQTNIFFKLMEERYRRRPTIITSNLDYPEWQTFLGNKALVDALLSRLRHQCHTIRIDGPSLRDPQG